MTSVEPAWSRNCWLIRAISVAATRWMASSQRSSESKSVRRTPVMRRSKGELTERVRWRLHRTSSVMAFAAMFLISADDALDERMTDHVAAGKLDDGNAVHISQSVMGLDQPGMFMRRQVDLRLITRHDGFRTVAQAGKEHEHLFDCGVLRFVQDDKRVVQRASAHIGEGRDLDGASLHVFLDLLSREHVVERVVERAEIGRDFFVKVAGQKTERFAGLDGRAGQNDPRSLFVLERLRGHGHREVGLAGAGRADAERHIVLADCLEVFLLTDGLWSDS